MEIRVRCPRCGYVMSIFDEAALRANKALRRAYEHALRNPVLCAGCSSWVQRPRIDRGVTDELPEAGDSRASRTVG